MLPKVLIVIPAYNEQAVLAKNIKQLVNFCRQSLVGDFFYSIIIADNNSTDQTSEIGKSLAVELLEVEYFFVAIKGKGAAIISAWENFTADVYCFMDADLATDLEALPKLIKSMMAGADLAIGSRFSRNSKVQRSIIRKIFSLGYRTLIKIIFKTKVSDLPCGFKAINQKTKALILPKIFNREWFFDSELVLLAEHFNLKIMEVPVIWMEKRSGDDKSKVKLFSLAKAYLAKSIELKKRLKTVYEKF
ncbi:MAG: glycosyltransferase [Candidatus Buchananbacteria bacterium]|nr:glycosyltransferase [Candidatus Buchananbacteria bacterium]